MSRPSFQFYPGDWRKNANLGRCSYAARGAWVDVLCVLHDSDDGYGIVRYPLRELANAAHAPLRLLRELADKRVLKGCDSGVCEPFVYVPRSGRRDGAPVVLVPELPGPIWYSSRMVRDEYVRAIRGESTRFEESDGPSNPSPKGGLGAGRKPSPNPGKGDGASSSSSSSASQREESAQSAEAGVDGYTPTSGGMACRVMREAGMAQTNPGDPRLLALLQQGATLPEFAGIAREAVEKGKGFAWVLVALAARRQDAAQLSLAAPRTSESAWERGQRERMEAFTGGLVSAKAPEHAFEERGRPDAVGTVD